LKDYSLKVGNYFLSKPRVKMEQITKKATPEISSAYRVSIDGEQFFTGIGAFTHPT
jgi:hypothetical protein